MCVCVLCVVLSVLCVGECHNVVSFEPAHSQRLGQCFLFFTKGAVMSMLIKLLRQEATSVKAPYYQLQEATSSS